MLQEVSTGTHRAGHFASFVQVRGSIPLFWSQDTNAMVPKPNINGAQRVVPVAVLTLGAAAQ
jgi:hypothetical protein